MKTEEVVKKTVYLFKRFARQYNFFEEYKMISNRLGFNPKMNNSSYRRAYYPPISFIELVRQNEPVKLIQSPEVFCGWPNFSTKSGYRWRGLSEKWADICLKNQLYHNRDRAFEYVRKHILLSIANKYDKGRGS